MIIKKNILFFLLLHTYSTFTNNAIIILYGCSSTGKTSISSQLRKTLPGNWKYIASNQFRPPHRNTRLWSHINATISQGYNVIVDTHNSQFLIDLSKNANVFSVLLHCPPHKLIDHINQRNTNENQSDHRRLRIVLQEYCNKFKSVKKNQPHIIDTLKKKDLSGHGLLTSLTLKRYINKFFETKKQDISYVAPMFTTYDCLVDTGKNSISDCALKIKKEFLMKFPTI